MWHNTRRGFNLIRKRYGIRSFKLNLVNTFAIITCVCIIAASIYFVATVSSMKNKAKNIGGNEPTNEANAKVDIVDIYDNEKVDDKNASEKKFTIVALGDIMMGGEVGKNLNYGYSLAFKNVSEHIKSADYTVANLTTNITNVDDISDAKSKYLVKKDIVNAFNALGVDAVNVASDHMIDFGNTMFTLTKNILRDSDINVIGLEKDIVYAEKDGIRVAFIGINNVIIGSQYSYTKAGMYVYDLAKLKKTIKEARKKADTIVVMTHYGLENSHQVTNVMRWFAREIVDAGADIVLGSHALGVYPIEEYKGKLIVYSMGYFISDTDYEARQEKCIL